MEGDIKEVIGVLMRVLDGGEISRSEVEDLAFEATGDLQAALNEAFIKLFEADRPLLADRAHFLALMSRVMRQVLVDHARALGAAKRGGGEYRVPWDSNVEVAAERGGGEVALHGDLILRSGQEGKCTQPA